MQIFLILVAVLVATFATVAYFNFRRMKRLADVPESKKIINLTNKNFKQVTAKGVVLVDFWASWCMPCKMMVPILNEVAESVDGKAIIAKLNVENHQDLAGKFAVRSIPTIIMFKNGKEIDRMVGVKSKDYLLKKINKA
jgi:thioredoxin 1